MWKSEELDNHLKTSDTIQTEAAVYAEWNMNQPDNISKIGNYRYRPTYFSDPRYNLVTSEYDPLDIGNFYTGATDSDVSIESGFDDDDEPTLFIAPKEKMKTLYSLEDCFKPHRPRSGINKPLYLGVWGAPYPEAQYITNHSPIDKATNTQIINQNYIVNRPRYYMSHKDDIFKYWTSYRTEYGMPTPRPGMVVAQVLRQVERGVSFEQDETFYIEDAAPFVVYKNQIPTNKIVIKMQTNVGDIDLGNVRYGDLSISDPLYGEENKTIPIVWKIEKLNDTGSWQELISFDETSSRSDGSPIIGSNGYVEISYGLQVPEEYQPIFIFADTIASDTLLPDYAPIGYTYLVKENDNDRGTMHIYVTNNKEDVETFVPDYSWQVSDETINYNSKFVTQINNPDYFDDINGDPIYREFEWISGIRIVVKTMNKKNCTFDLIEMSPRLTANISPAVSSFSITKTMSDLGNGSIPVGGLFASIGEVEIFDTDFSFNFNNAFDFDTKTGSILADYLDMSIKFLFYDITRNVNGYDYFIPVKTMYAESFPQMSGIPANISINLRDFFFYLESTPAPQLFLTEISLSSAVSILLDYAGFTNYTFKRILGKEEMIIPYFFVEPDQNIATVLQKLALATQSAMFFDEYNNFVVMSKEYLLPEDENERPTDSTLYGQVEGENLPNIINLSSADKSVYNDGQINYTVRYIQRSIGSTKTAQQLDKYKQFIYKPVLLWEVQGRESTKTINELGAQNGGYTLGAVPLSSNLTSELPYVQSNTIFNNVIDVGENVYWIPSFSGYLYANGEIIKFDAIEYTVSGQSSPVWITNNQQYQNYMASLPFNGKMYPTGNLRIYAKPEYETIDEVVSMKNGQVKEHGRGQFGTLITNHLAGIDEYWTNNSSVRGCIMDVDNYLFTTNEYINYPSSTDPIRPSPTPIIINSTDAQINAITGSLNEIKQYYPSISNKAAAGKIQDTPYINADIFSQSSTRNGIIKNFLAEKYATEEEINYYKTTGPGTIQSSALIFNGPKFDNNSPKPSSFISYVYKDFTDQEGKTIPYKHFGTRMRIIGKIESGTNSSQTPTGGYSIFQGSSTSSTLSPTDPAQQIKIYGGSGGIAFGLNKETNNGYYYEIVALTSDNIKDYVSDNNPLTISYETTSSPPTSCTNNTVTLYTKTPITFEVGQTVLITGLVDKNLPSNVNTPLNGEYTISAIREDKKSIEYKIPTPSVTSLSITSASANGSIIKYVIPVGNTRSSYIKAGDKINISGTSNSDFNITNAVVKTFVQLKNEWFFTVDKVISGTATGGTATYVPLTTTSETAGKVSQQSSEPTSLANIYFYKIIPYDKTNSFIAYSIQSNILTLHFEKTPEFVVGEKVLIKSGHSVTNKSASAGVATLTIGTHFVGVGDSVTVDIGDQRFDGTQIVTARTNTTISYSTSFTVSSTSTSGKINFISEKNIKGISTNTITFDFISSNVAKTNFKGSVNLVNAIAMPVRLWRGLGKINVDSGNFMGQNRLASDQFTTVYDLAAEYINTGSTRKFFLYLNGKQIATVNDATPLPEYNNMALFVRGSSRCAFENVYALANNYSQNTTFTAQTGIAQIFGDDEIDASEALKKYALSGIIQKTYLSGISSAEQPQYKMYFEEFGTVLREMAYFNIKYDRAYPALYAKLMKTMNGTKGYTSSGFYAGSYGADFLIFNCTDFNLNIDDTSGNYLRIQGITFTQSTTYSLSVDDYFKKKSILAQEEIGKSSVITSPLKVLEEYNKIKNSRIRYGVNQFTPIESPYIQSNDAAEDVFGWIIDKVSVPKRVVGLNTFATNNLQLGDIVTINYKDPQGEGINIVSPEDIRFVIYNIEYQKNVSGLTTTLYLVEV